MTEWFQIGTAVWNWALSRYQQTQHETRRGRTNYFDLCADAKGHAVRIGFNAQCLEAILKDHEMAWQRYRDGIAGEPRRKGLRNRLSSLPLRNDKRYNTLRRDGRKALRLPGLGAFRTGGMRGLPDAQLVTGRVHRRARGWYVTITLDAEPKAIPLVGRGAVGIDLGYSTLATLSTGEKIEHPHEYRRRAERLGQAQRGRRKKLVGRIQQSNALARRTRNHSISRDLVSRFDLIVMSRDNTTALQRRWGKSVLDAGHYELRDMLATKSRQAGRRYLEVSNKNSTRMCSSCGALTGPHGLHGLSVRAWACACGAHWDRDVNAALNTLRLGAVLAHESVGDGASGISVHH